MECFASSLGLGLGGVRGIRVRLRIRVRGFLNETSERDFSRIYLRMITNTLGVIRSRPSSTP